MPGNDVATQRSLSRHIVRKSYRALHSCTRWASAVCFVARAGLRAPSSVMATGLPVLVNSVAIENSLSCPKFCHDIRPLSRHMAKELCRDQGHQACLRAVSRHKKPCHDTGQEHQAGQLCGLRLSLLGARRAQAGSCARHEDHVATQKTMSQHNAKQTLSRQRILCRDINAILGSSLAFFLSCTSCSHPNAVIS